MVLHESFTSVGSKMSLSERNKWYCIGVSDAAATRSQKIAPPVPKGVIWVLIGMCYKEANLPCDVFDLEKQRSEWVEKDVVARYWCSQPAGTNFTRTVGWLEQPR